MNVIWFLIVVIACLFLIMIITAMIGFMISAIAAMIGIVQRKPNFGTMLFGLTEADIKER